MKNLKLIIFSIIMLMVGGNLLAQDWASSRVGADGASHISEVAYPPLALQWNYKMFSKIVASPIVADNKVFIGNITGAFYALDAYTGDVIWQFSAGERIDTTACYSEGIVYFGSLDGFVYALSAADGSLVWSRDLGTQIVSSPKVNNGKLYIGEGSASNNIVVLDAATGQTLGSLATGQPVHSSFCFLGNDFFVGSNDGALYRGDTSTYVGMKSYQSDGSFGRSSPSTDGSSVYISPGHDEKKVYRINVITNSPQDESAELASTACRTSSPAIYDGAVYVNIGWTPVKTFALDASDLSTELWQYDIGNIGNEGAVPEPSITRNCVYTHSYAGKIIALKQFDGSLLYENTISNNAILSQPVISNGWIYMGTSEGYLKAYKADQIVAIASPRDYEINSSTTVTIKGTVIVDNLSSLSLAYGQGVSPSEWVNIANKTGSFDNADITEWYTDTLADGVYTLRLTAAANPASSLDLESRVPVVINLPPAAPGGVSLSDVANGLSLSWTLSVDDGSGDNDITSYRIYRSTISRQYGSYLDTVANGTVGYTDSTVQSAKQYFYRIKSYDGLSEGEFSGEVYNTLVTETDWENIPVAEGGEVNLPDGTKAIIPAGTFDEDVYVKIKILQEEEYVDTGDNIMFKGTVIAREFSVLTPAQLGVLSNTEVSLQARLVNTYSSSIVFNKLVTIQIPYKYNEITDIDESKLHVAYWNSGSSLWSINQTSEVDSDGLTVRALVNHFSTHRIVENSWISIAQVEGGTVQLLDGTKAVIQSDTFNEDTWVYIKTLQEGEYSSTGLDPRFNTGNIARRFYSVSDTQMNAVSVMAQSEQAAQIKTYSAATGFNELIQIEIPYTEAEVSGMNKNRLRMITYDESELKWKMVNTSVPDTDNSRVVARVSHFTDYQVIQFAPAGDLLDKNKVYTYPNPAYGNELYFKYYSGDDSFITVDVYNVAGERVAHLTGDGTAGLVNEIHWDIKRYASGIYMYVMEAKSKFGDSKKKIVKKLAIIK